MSTKSLIILIATVLILTVSCKEEKTLIDKDAENTAMDYEQEKQAILQTLKDETKAAFQRDYVGWKEKWVHDATITKTYMNFTDSTFSESLGWNEINSFVKAYFEEHPDLEPIPSPLKDINVRLYGNGAWVSYLQRDDIRGLKRETRLMEKVKGQWRIAGMSTTIYGKQEE